MALLDDLKKQAQQKAAQDTQDSSKTLQGADLNWKIIAPKLMMIQNYFKDLVETLNVVEPEDDFQFMLMKGVLFRNLKKRDFKLTTLQQGGGRTLALRYDLVGELNQKLSVNNEVVIEKIRNLLTELHIKFTMTSESMSKSTFVIKPLLTTKLRFTADAPARIIDFELENFDTAGTQHVRIKPELINDKFLEEIAKYILGKPNKLMEMAGYTMPEDLRRQLQEKLDRGKKAKEERERSSKAKDSAILETTASKLKSLFKR